MPRLPLPAFIRPLGLLFVFAVPNSARGMQDIIEIDGPVRIDRSCDVRVADIPRGVDSPGLVTITADDITVRFLDALDGTAGGQAQHELVGTGILVTGKRVTLQGARVHGFQVGIHARGADGLVLEDCHVSRNFAQLLGSTPQREDSRDWLWPHANDDREWTRNYGAGIYVERSRNLTVRRCVARSAQNGLILDRVTHSQVYDNDFSFLSGWGIAMWRSSDNVIARNATDFCVRGYSHGIYNRGQDSAGILMFEQCCRNVIAENSGTHSGDGLFGFAGKEALGEHDPPAGFDHTRKGNLDNLILANDFSYSVAHGIEMTFSFGNVLRGNRLTENAICGIWGGYSKDTVILDNHFEKNGSMAYGLERGGINIEHGERNRILENTFIENACGVHLWWDADEGLAKLPWSKANGHGCGDTQIDGNTFQGDTVGIHMRACGRTEMQNRFVDVGEEYRLEDAEAGKGSDFGPYPHDSAEEELRHYLGERKLPGRTRPVGARRHLAGRQRILMTRYGPYDWQSTYLQFIGPTADGAHEYRLLGAGDIAQVQLAGQVELEMAESDGFPLYRIRPANDPAGEVSTRASSYRLRVSAGNTSLEESGTLLPSRWRVRCFAWTHDPREDMEGWLADSEQARSFEVAALDLKYAAGGPSQLENGTEALRTADLPRDRFGTLAETTIILPPGTWKLTSTSDDGIRVRVDGNVVIEDWTWHAPKDHVATFAVDEERPVTIAVEHFELDGYAVLSLRLRRAE